MGVICWPRLAGVGLLVLGTLSAVACGDDDDADATATPDDGATIIEQSTVGNVGPYRIGVARVDAGSHSASVSIMSASGEKVADATLTIGSPYQLADGALHLLETRDGGSNRDTIRIRFQAGN